MNCKLLRSWGINWEPILKDIYFKVYQNPPCANPLPAYNRPIGFNIPPCNSWVFDCCLRLEHNFGPGEGWVNKPIFKSSNVLGIPQGEGVLMLPIDQCIRWNKYMEILRDPGNIQAFWKRTLLLSKIVIDNSITQHQK